MVKVVKGCFLGIGAYSLRFPQEITHGIARPKQPSNTTGGHMGFLRKTTFVLTGGSSGLVFKANSKKERTARAAEDQATILRRLADQDDTMVVDENDDGVFYLTLSDELRNLGELHAEGILNDEEFADAKRQLLG